MFEKDKRVDAYIEKSAAFAQPILKKLRKLIAEACPDAVETIKWGFPNFEVYGSVFCNMAAFKEHCSFGFWKAALLKDSAGILHLADKHAMGNLDKIRDLKDLPSEKILFSYLKEAALLNKNNVKVSRPKKIARKELPVPPELEIALKKNKKAMTGFNAFSPSQRREYIEWIAEAKTLDTKSRRIEMTMEWSAEGKTRNWKYKKD
jgi:uncharacterized protein YdeI (YjbR/CyaY-like superfamily)